MTSYACLLSKIINPVMKSFSGPLHVALSGFMCRTAVFIWLEKEKVNSLTLAKEVTLVFTVTSHQLTITDGCLAKCPRGSPLDRFCG